MSKKKQDRDSLLFCPLGGSGEIGMNMNLFCCQGQWIMVDCGMTFGDPSLPGIDLVFPDPSFIADRRDDLLALVLTHGHEDHIGAVPYLWRRLRCPIYATPFTAELVRGKLSEAGLLKEVDLRVIDRGGTLEEGPFRITYVPLAHSIPEGNGLKIETPLGTLFHTGDWKLDDEPQIGAPSSPEDLSGIGEEGVLAMIGDSTNVFNASASGSEQTVKDTLSELVAGMTGRVVVTTFASNVARLQTIAAVARENRRKIVLVGRSMHRVVGAAKATGYLRDWPESADEDEVANLPRDKVLILCTGAQGEPRAALSRIATGSHRNIRLDSGDMVIFSSKIIPGNDLTVARLINDLALRDIDVLTEREAHVHVSGHPGRAELERMYSWIRPKIAVPVHGEPRHLRRHAQFARELGVEQSLAPSNGDIIRLAPGPAAVIDQAPTGRLALDGKILVRTDSDSIAARRRILMNGYIGLVVMVDEDDTLAGDPEVLAEGVPGLEPGGDLEDEVITATEKAQAKAADSGRAGDKDISEAIRVAVRRLVRQRTDKNPVVEVRYVRFEDSYV